MRADLLTAGYTVDGVSALLGDGASSALHRDQLAPARWTLDRRVAGRDCPESACPESGTAYPESACPESGTAYPESGTGCPVSGTDSALATLVRLFLLAEPCPVDEVAAALPTAGVPAAIRLGLLAGDGELLRARLDLRPYAEADGPPWWTVSDLAEAVTGRPLATGHVLGVGQASLTLAAATIRRPVRRAVDLGTGCGVQAMHLSRHAARVVATDIDRRALRLAGLGLALSDCEVDLRHGDLLAALGGRHDLIVSNPPFVITPRRADVPTYTYRDAGRVGDEVVAELVTGLGHHLTEGGIAQLLANWEVRRGEHWSQRLHEWLAAATDGEDQRLDAWVIQRDLLDPAGYAALWVRDSGTAAAHRDALTRAWLDDFAARDVEAIGMGLITLRRPGPGTARLRRLEFCPQPLASPLGAHLDTCLAAHDVLAALSDEQLLARRLRVADGVVEQRLHRPGQDEPFALAWRCPHGPGHVVDLDPAVAAVFGACDGELPLGVLAMAVAQLLEQPTDAVIPALLAAVRELVPTGALLPA